MKRNWKDKYPKVYLGSGILDDFYFFLCDFSDLNWESLIFTWFLIFSFQNSKHIKNNNRHSCTHHKSLTNVNICPTCCRSFFFLFYIYSFYNQRLRFNNQRKLTQGLSKVFLEITSFLTLEQAASTVNGKPSTWLSRDPKKILGHCCNCQSPQEGSWGCRHSFDAWKLSPNSRV